MRIVYYHWILSCKIWNRSEVSPTSPSFVALDKPYWCTWVFHTWKSSSFEVVWNTLTWGVIKQK